MEPANLQMLIELAATARDAAAVRHAQATQALEQARGQMDTLRSYARDYERRAQNTLTQGCDLAAQNNLRAFNGKLQQAMQAQSAELERREAALAAATDELNAMQRKFKSMQALADRRSEAARQTASRREQKTQDEMARNVQQRPLAPSGW
jgi:flagellar export protein FliJ